MVDNRWKPVVDIIMPTYDNWPVLNQAVITLNRNTSTPYRLFVANNGTRPINFQLDDGQQPHYVHVLDMGENKGWMGGINETMEIIKKDYGGLSDYVLFCNDDVRFLDHHNDWLINMVRIMRRYPEVGACGPSSNNVMYHQSLRFTAPPYYSVPVLSGFCMLVRKEAIEKIGGLDEGLFGGDDIDYSMRLRDAGYKLVCCRRSFVFHLYAQTGRRLHPEWDSQEWTDKINRGLIQKHGFKKWLSFNSVEWKCDWYDNLEGYGIEKRLIQEAIGNVNGHKVLDLGCGGSKILDNAIGVDIVDENEYSNSGRWIKNDKVDVVADISESLPFEDNEADFIVAKHVLEHIVDHLKALKEWGRVLKEGGKIILAVPDPDLIGAIVCDPTHVHTFTKDSIKTALEMTGFKVDRQTDLAGGWSFITIATKEAE